MARSTRERKGGGWGGDKCKMAMNRPQNLILHFRPPPPWIWILITPRFEIHRSWYFSNNYQGNQPIIIIIILLTNLRQLPSYKVPIHPPKAIKSQTSIWPGWNFVKKCKLLGPRHLITADLQWFGPPTNDFTFFRPSSQQGLTGIVTLYKASTPGFSLDNASTRIS